MNKTELFSAAFKAYSHVTLIFHSSFHQRTGPSCHVIHSHLPSVSLLLAWATWPTMVPFRAVGSWGGGFEKKLMTRVMDMLSFRCWWKMHAKALSDSWKMMCNNLVITYGLKERKSFKPRFLEERWQKVGIQGESWFWEKDEIGFRFVAFQIMMGR